ncbi:hypothetical protein AQUCO_15400001v1 [Aquilegia coerulea]|uniref:SHSP domain-containing protein n=1 Tax=Aquilegia coerulea TaxID=218851 RepID=A0A2G5C0U1_AQUCA|nr:hypothetical protein AQUCO_15400001v1 [Aquilegia coerulea]
MIVTKKRRSFCFVAHFAATMMLMNCSSSVNSVARRCDNRMLFARQGSISQACFMRQVSIEESSGANNSSHNCVPPHSSCSAIKDSSCNPLGTPLFSRPIQMKPQASIVEYRPAKQECQLSLEGPPKFSRPYKGFDGRNKNSENIRSDGTLYDVFNDASTSNISFPFVMFLTHLKTHNLKRTHQGVKELSPRMDVAESKWYYVMTVELPGSSMNSIRVEVDEKK